MVGLSSCAQRGFSRGNGGARQRVDQLASELGQAREHVQALERQLGSRQQEVNALKAEVQQLRGAAAVEGKSTGASRSGTSAADAALRRELAKERERRQALESELIRLKEETSSPVYGERMVRESEYLSVKQELVDLRRVAEEDRHARDRLAEQLRTLQSSQGQVAGAASDNPEQRAQVESLQRERDQIITNLNKTLTASQQRAAELETALAAAKSGGGDTSVREENLSLRSRLDEQRRHTEQLEAKLRVATRVADLIFRMQAQQPSGGDGRAKRR
jgi:chromosome segregation ATPase